MMMKPISQPASPAYKQNFDVELSKNIQRSEELLAKIPSDKTGNPIYKSLIESIHKNKDELVALRAKNQGFTTHKMNVALQGLFIDNCDLRSVLKKF